MIWADDSYLLREARLNKDALSAARDKSKVLEQIFANNDIVVAICPDPDRPSTFVKHIMKGKGTLTLIAQTPPGVTVKRAISAIFCDEIRQADVLRKAYGDERVLN